MSVIQHHLPGIEPVLPAARRMTEDEFLVRWEDEQLREWVDGEAIEMTPTWYDHNDLVGWLAAVLRFYCEARTLGTVAVDTWTRIPTRPSRRAPDIAVVRSERASIVLPTHIDGPPDLIVEITSPDSLSRDWREKYLEYEAAGVAEYWVIDLASQRGEFYSLLPAAEGQPRRYGQIAVVEGWIESKILPGFRLRVEWFWPAARPKLKDALAALGLP